jgi:hypothetical protein
MDRQFEPEEAQEIIKRSARLQAESDTEPDYGRLSLEELEELATEVGIDPVFVERAVQEIEGRSKRKKRRFGAAGTQLLNRTVNVILTNEAWEEMVDELRLFVGKPGTLVSSGATREWTGGYDVGTLTLTASVRGGVTRLRLLSEYNGGLGLAWTTGGVTALMGSLLLWKALTRVSVIAGGWAIGVAVTLGLVILLATQWIISAWEAKHRPRLLALMNRLSDKVENVGVTPIYTPTPVEEGLSQGGLL